MISPLICRRFFSSSKRRVRLAFLGAPGAGKGTFAKKVGPHFGIPMISTGDLVRDEIKRKTPLGERIKEINARGELVPDETIVEMTKKRLARDDTANGFILDGFPRTVAQAEAFEKFEKLDAVLNIDIEEDILVIKTISRRTCEDCGQGYNLANIKRGDLDMPPLLPKVEGKCDKCNGKLVQRADDTDEIVRNRLQVYAKQTYPLIEFYKKRGLLKQFRVKRGIADTPDLIKFLEESL